MTATDTAYTLSIGIPELIMMVLMLVIPLALIALVVAGLRRAARPEASRVAELEKRVAELEKGQSRP